MTTSDQPRPPMFDRSRIGATILALALLLSGGWAYRSASSYLGRSTDGVKLPPGALAALPLRIGAWSGEDVPLANDVIRATGTDDHLNRTYYRREPRGTTTLFVGFGINLRDLAPHRPEVCYPGAGWTLEDRQDLEATLGDGRKLPCRVHRFRRGTLRSEHITVLHFYLIDGEVFSDVGALRRLQWRHGEQRARYAVQVQMTSGESDPDVARRIVLEFAQDAAAAIVHTVETAVNAALAENES